MFSLETLEQLRRVRIELNPEIYPWKPLKETLTEFENICEWEIEETESNFVIMLISKKEVDLKKLGYEFMNYLLAKTKETI